MRFGAVRYGRHGTVRRGKAWHRVVRQGKAGGVRRRKVELGVVRFVTAGMAQYGWASLGGVWIGR